MPVADQVVDVTVAITALELWPAPSVATTLTVAPVSVVPDADVAVRLVEFTGLVVVLTATVGGAVSSRKVDVAAPVLPAVSVWRAATV